MVQSNDIRVPQDIANTLANPAAHASGEIHDACHWLRANNPFAVAEPEGFDPFWIVAKYEDIKAIAQQNKIFFNGERNISLIDKVGQQRIREMMGGFSSITRNIVNMDPPDHPKYRALAEGYFTRGSIAKLESTIRLIAREFVDKLVAMGGSCDFAQDIAFMYPLRVVMSILGIPDGDAGLMLKLTHEIAGIADPDLAPGGIALTGAEAAEAIGVLNDEFDAYCYELLTERRKNPRDDFLTVIATAEIDGAPLAPFEASNYAKIVATAGHETTSAATAGGVWGLCEYPGEFARAKADPALMPGLVAEAIRWTTPAKLTMRMAMQDVEYAGYSIKTGDSVGLAWVSANRDETIFPEPAAFKIDRPPQKPLSFGWGAHGCLGQHLARLEMRILFEEMLPRLGSIALAGEPKNVVALTISGPKTVPIHYSVV